MYVYSVYYSQCGFHSPILTPFTLLACYSRLLLAVLVRLSYYSSPDWTQLDGNWICRGEPENTSYQLGTSGMVLEVWCRRKFHTLGFLAGMAPMTLSMTALVTGSFVMPERRYWSCWLTGVYGGGGYRTYCCRSPYGGAYMMAEFQDADLYSRRITQYRKLIHSFPQTWINIKHHKTN